MGPDSGRTQTSVLLLPAAGDLVAGRYRIRSQLGSGGFGVVYHARQESMGRDVAIKFLSPKITSDPVAVERFRREAFNASGLRHPNTITLHDYGQDDQGRFYIVMELLEGQPLSRAIFEGGGLPLGRALNIGEQILCSLGEAHQQGLVHRDLKPENIFLTTLLGEPDFVKVLDFGLSKAIETPDPSLTQEGVVFGTPLYMAPEQAYGEEVVPASDLFAFGLLFYEMLAGKRPYSGRSSMDVMLKLTQQPMPRLPEPLTTSPVATYLNRLTEKEPGDRFKDAVQALPVLRKLRTGTGLETNTPFESIYVGLQRKTTTGTQPGLIPAGDLLGDLFAPDELAASEKQVQRAELIVSGQQAAIESLADATLADHINPIANIKLQSTSEQPAVTEATKPEAPKKDEEGPDSGVFVDLHARSKKRAHRYDTDSDEIRTVITRIDVSGDERSRSVRSLSDLFFEVPLVGRQTEVDALEKRAQHAARGRGGMLMVEGDAGVGKTSIITEMRARIEAVPGVRVVHGAYHQNSTGPGAGLREAIEDLLGIRGMEDERALPVVRRRMDQLDLGRPEFVRILMSALRPTLAMDVAPKLSAIRIASPLAFRVLERLLMGEAHRQPTILILEDLHWADPFALGFVDYLASSLSMSISNDSAERLIQRPDPLPLLCVATLRRSHAISNPTLVSIFQRMGKFMGKGFGRLEINPLSAEDSAKLISRILPLHSDLMAHVVRAARGNPLYLIQALRLMASRRILKYHNQGWSLMDGAEAQLPTTIDELLSKRVERLATDPDTSKRIAQIAELISVLGPQFRQSLVKKYFIQLGRAKDLELIGSAITSLVAGGILRRLAGKEIGFAYEHDLIQEVLAAQILTENANTLHQAAANSMEFAASHSGVYAADSGFLANMAEHWSKAGDEQRSVDALIRSAVTAERSLDLASARHLYRRAENALEALGETSPRRSRVQRDLASLYMRRGELGPARDLLGRSVAIDQALGDQRCEGRALAMIGDLLTMQSSYSEALDTYRVATQRFLALGSQESEDLAGLAQALHGQGEIARLRGSLAEGERLFQEALDKARFAGTKDVEAHCLHGLGRIAHVSGKLRTATRFLNQALERFNECGLVIASATVASDLGLAQLYTDGRGVAENAVRRAIDILDTAGEPLMCAHARVHLGLALRRGPDLDKASAVAEEAMETFTHFSHGYGVAKAVLLKGEIAHARGDHEMAREYGNASLAKHEELGDAHGIALTLLNLGAWELEDGELQRAEELLNRSITLFEKHNILLYHPVGQLHLGRIAEERGELERAQEYYADGVRRARESENCEVEALGATLLGGVALILGNLSRARGFLSTAMDVANTIDEAELRALTVFGIAWVETLSGKEERSKKYTERLRQLHLDAPTHNFYLRERVSRIVKAVRLSRGPKQADWYRQTALDVLKNIGPE